MNGLHDLLSARAVRARCAQIGALAEAGETRYFRYCPDRLDPCVSLVARECQTNYPDLNIPLHSRWRHFVIDGIDLWQHYRERRLGALGEDDAARTAIDLAFVSVILDAGAGPEWQYRDPVTGALLSRSEGLAASTVDLFFNALVADANPPRLSACAIREITPEVFARAFQSDHANPLVGVEGRRALLNGLADRLESLGIQGPGDILDQLRRQFGQSVPAGEVLAQVLNWFNPIWPSGLWVNGVSLGDCGRHSQVNADNVSDGLVPFHKLSQWLTWSLMEPLGDAGITVTDLDQLTGLPEYRNGGLLIDTGLLQPVDVDLLERSWPVDSELVVEWRALTVWLLDRIAVGVRDELGLTADKLSLGSVLQGGTWSAGRRLANEHRGGLPPIRLGIDGTVF